MHTLRRFPIVRRPLAAGLLAAAAALCLSQPAAAKHPDPAVPCAIAVPAGHQAFLAADAVGVQIYRCDVTAVGSAWTFVAPRAVLYKDNGKLLTTHYAGPTWEATDGSKVVGRRVDGVSVDADAIPWLLLAAASTSAGPDGDRLARTTYIQRIATTGGVAPPAAQCHATTAGVVREVPYTAEYVFWKAR
jgi:hypothetical protein